MQIEAFLDTWRAWDAPLCARPGLVRALGGGRSNHSFLLDSNGSKVVLRINAKDDLLPNRRANEAKTWQAASAAGIAPPLLYADPNGIFLVSVFIENSLPQNSAHDVAFIRKAFDLLQRCHRLEVDVPVIDYAAHIDRYWRIIGERGLATGPALQKQREPMRLVLEALIKGENATGLCHHDPVQENFVGSPENLYLVDWEYAAQGLTVMDYAAFAVEWGIEAARICERAGTEPELLTIAMDFYRYQCRLWEAISLTQPSRLDSESNRDQQG